MPPYDPPDDAPPEPPPSYEKDYPPIPEPPPDEPPDVPEGPDGEPEEPGFEAEDVQCTLETLEHAFDLLLDLSGGLPELCTPSSILPLGAPPAFGVKLLEVEVVAARCDAQVLESEATTVFRWAWTGLSPTLLVITPVLFGNATGGTSTDAMLNVEIWPITPMVGGGTPACSDFDGPLQHAVTPFGGGPIPIPVLPLRTPRSIILNPAAIGGATGLLVRIRPNDAVETFPAFFVAWNVTLM